MADKVTATMLLDKLEMQGVLLLREVRNAGGFNADRSLDGMSIGTWPSKGHHLTGYEVKISRQDWLKEMSDLTKADAFRPFCKYFYLVSAQKVAEEHEIPETWGWLEWDGRRMVCRKKAPKNEQIAQLPAGMMAAMFKRTEDSAYQRGGNATRRQMEAQIADFDARLKQGVDQELRWQKTMNENVRAFLARAGLRPTEYALADLTKDDLVMDIIKSVATRKGPDRWTHPLTQMTSLIRTLSGYADALEEAKRLQGLINNAADMEGLKNDLSQ